MNSMTWMVGIGLGLTLAASRRSAPATQRETTFDVVEKARVCTPSHVLGDAREVDCDFRVGRSFRFSIAGVGSRGGYIAFKKSDIDGDYYGTVGLVVSCVTVRPGSATVKGEPWRVADWAFVSSVDGRVYHNWPACQAAK